MEIGFNSRFLMELLNNVESSEIRIEMSDPSRAGLIIPNEPHVEAEDLLLLVMPVMVGR
jgi:DNA polymerase III subunit beta